MKGWHEDKQETLKQLQKLLLTTRYYKNDLVNIAYEYRNGDEYAVIRFISGNVVSVNITADSCLAMIKDVLKYL